MNYKNVTKSLTWVLVCALFLTICPWAAAFSDVSQNAWYASAVDFVYSRGLFAGTSTTTFSPNDLMSRGMFVTVLGRYASVSTSSTGRGIITSCVMICICIFPTRMQ